MSVDKQLLSKLLVLDEVGIPLDSRNILGDESYGLIGIRPQHGTVANVMDILKSNVDLGAIMLYENYHGTPSEGISLARRIHAVRPELPLFLRRDAEASVAGLNPKDAALFRCAFTLENPEPLRATLDSSIFNRIYPTSLVRGLAEMTRTALASLFTNCDIEVETPYLIKDRIIYGEVFTLIALESHWCRGYMMLQGEENALMGLVRAQAGEKGEGLTFRDLNSSLGEATNLVWGAFKNRYVNHSSDQNSPLQTQVPIIINHQRRYISFGADDPQLCLKYWLREQGHPDAAPVPLYQRFVFNLNWSPDAFSENPSVESMCDSGELELF